MRTKKHSALPFFILVFALSLPFWSLGSTSHWQFFPGIPISALSVVCPSLAAIICTYRDHALAGVPDLLKRSVDLRSIKPIWLLPILFLIPATSIVAFVSLQVLGMPLPHPDLNWPSVCVLFFVFLVAAMCEELGWSGFAIDRLQSRWSALSASITLGAVWAAWHIVPLEQADRSNEWIAWWCVGTIALRVLHTWLYNNTAKSVFGAALFHASNNTSWQLFPIRGSHFDPKINAIVLIFVATTVVLFFGPNKLRISYR
jgi:membrane protease YdiL (CAAX protease family)